MATAAAGVAAGTASRVGTAPGTGIYLHVPFCAHRCHYCDFNTYAGLDDEMPRYVAALHAEVERTAAAGPRGVAPPGAAADRDWPPFTSVFVGGGTPTLLPADALAGVLRHLRDALPVSDDAEVTVEANPETVTEEAMATLVTAGVNRISMGAQSFSPHVLAFLGRRHDRERPLRAVADARAAGVGRVNLDLIYGAPAENDEDWAASLRTVLAAGTDHVSAYALTLEPNTEYAARVRAGSAAAPDDDVAAARMATADVVLGGAGFRRYEISNWAKPGEECRHNLTYWQGGNWLAFGAGSHGHWDGRRWWNLRAPARYGDAALAGEPAVAGEEVLDDEARRVERLLLGLRLAEGVRRDDVAPVDEAAVRRLVAAGLLSDDGERLALTDRGKPLGGAVTLELAG